MVVGILTNAEKYLKPDMRVAMWKDYNQTGQKCKSIWQWLDQEAKPPLTEDERVILRNIHTDKWGIIGKSNFNELYLKNYADTDEIFLKEIFEKNSFPSIKKRRRVRDSRTFERRIKKWLNY